jgi:hypothetical protein
MHSKVFDTLFIKMGAQKAQSFVEEVLGMFPCRKKSMNIAMP